MTKNTPKKKRIVIEEDGAFSKILYQEKRWYGWKTINSEYVSEDAALKHLEKTVKYLKDEIESIDWNLL